MFTSSYSLTDYFRGLKNGLRSDLILYVMVAVYTIPTILYFTYTGRAERLAYPLYYGPWLLNNFVLLPALMMGIGAIRIYARSHLRRSLIVQHLFSPRRVSRYFAGMVLLVAMMFHIGTFTSLKSIMPNFGGFVWDERLADIDQILHFGVDPWLYIYDVFGTSLLWILEINYNIYWFILCFFTLFWIITSSGADKIRLRYVSCYILTWIILGNLYAVLFLSAGPAFYGHVTGDEVRFAGQLAFLAQGAEGPNSVVAYQDYLWSSYISDKAGLGTGISAFPSVHVGLITLNALFARELNVWLGRVAMAYVGVIMISSVYLGWHYAIDGYFSFVVVWLIYSFAKKVPFEKWSFRHDYEAITQPKPQTVAA